MGPAGFLEGNVSEWTLDWYAPYGNPCSDCANVTPATARVVRGGYIGCMESELPGWVRGQASPSLHNAILGFRCARSP